MSDVRKFWLENQDGEMWYFTEEESKTFLESPRGLGFTYDYGGFRLGNVNLINYTQAQLLDITGTLLFYKSSRPEIYQQYFEFMNFIKNNSLLKLHCKTPNTFETYYRYCFVRELDKSEIDNGLMVMRCPVVFVTQTLWRNDKKNSVVADRALADGKSYPLERPYYYPASKFSNIKAVNRGNSSTPMKVTILGRSNNPTISVYDHNNKRYGVIRMLGEFDKVVIDSDDLNQTIYLEKDGAVLTAPYSYQDLSVGQQNEVFVTFVKLKSGESTLVFTNDDPFDGSVIIEWSDEYVSI